VPLTSSPDSPLPVRTVAQLIGQWISRLGRVWVEGQVTEAIRRPGTSTVFLTLRDPVADVSLRATCARTTYDALSPPLSDGARVVVHGKPQFLLARGIVSLDVTDIRPVGVGELLARLERLKAALAAEGLFAAERKRPLPFLPRTVGLICGRGSAAERDVLENARRRWPAVRFRVENVAVQGPFAVTEVCAALDRLDRDSETDVIVVTRGGGSVEDLLPFSDEALLRRVAAVRAPVVSAIGHEQDTPLLDLVADVRASTPTDAGKRIVPDVTEEQTRVTHLRDRARRALTARLAHEAAYVAAVRHRPALADPIAGLLAPRQAEVSALRDRARRCLGAALARAGDDLAHTRARIRALSPAATLDRGYAVVQRADGVVVRDPGQVNAGESLAIRVAGGRFGARATDPADLG
jgi:exodeoxyribonuclease VII large subunit